MKIDSIYIHIPFCEKKCAYCDFVSLPQNKWEGIFDSYPHLLRRELELWDDDLDFSPLKTIYFGGGTPSLLSPDDVSSLLSLFPKAEEITLEANPDSLNEEKAHAFLQAGANRLSLGIQSFDDNLLHAMGRVHNSELAKKSLAEARAAGFGNIGIDLIYGLPEQSLDMWRADIESAITLAPQHMSLYCLSLSEITPWGLQKQKGELALPSDDTAADMFELARDLLEQAGFRHYEIANFAKPGYESSHNTAYWQRKNYLGLGAAAASCIAEHRWVNSRDVVEYAEAIENKLLPIIEEEVLNIDQVIAEAIFLGLRLMDGIDFAAFEKQYGLDPRKRFRRQISKLTKEGLLEADEKGMRLTRKGVLLGNRAFEQFV